MAQSSEPNISGPNIPVSKPLSEKDNPEVRKIWWVVFILQAAWGFTEGLYLYTYGPYFYEKFGGVNHAGTAMLLTTILLGMRQGLVALLEVPTGALADAIGRVHTIILSWVFRVLFFAFLAAIALFQSIAFAFTFGILASIAFAITYTFFNGAFSAWCAEKLKEANSPYNYAWLASRFYSYRSFAALLGTFLGVGCYIIGLHFMGYCIAAVVSFICMGFCMTKMQETKTLEFVKWEKGQWGKLTRRIGEVIGRGFQVALKTPVLLWVIVTYGNYMFLLSIICYLWPVYLRSKGGVNNFSATWITIACLTWIVMFLGSRGLAWLNDRWSKTGGTSAHIASIRRIYVSSSVLSALFVLGLSWETFRQPLTPLFFPIAILFVLFSFGIIGPCFETLVNHYIPPSDASERATILSTGSMFRSFMILLLAVPTGGKSGETSPIGWAIPATLLLVSAVIANFSMRKAQKVQALPAAGAVAATGTAGAKVGAYETS